MENISELKIRLTEAEENLNLVQTRIANFVDHNDVDLQYIKDEKRFQNQIRDLEAQIGIAEGTEPIIFAENLLVKCQSLSNKLQFESYNKVWIDKVDELRTEIESWLAKYYSIQSNSKLLKTANKNIQFISQLNEINRNVISLEEKSFINSLAPAELEYLAFSEISPPEIFVDREGDVQQLAEKFQSHRRITVVTGAKGVGTSSLLRQFAATDNTKQKIWIECSRDIGLREFFSIVGEIFVKDFEIFTVKELHYNQTKMTINKIQNLLGKMDVTPLCIYLDDFHLANEEFQSLIDYVKRFTIKIKLLISTNRLTDILEKNFGSIEKIVLRGIPEIHISDFLEKYHSKIDPSISKDIFQLTKGNPEILKLFASACYNDELEPTDILKNKDRIFKSDLDKWLIKRIYDDLETDERELLCKLSVLNNPFPIHILDNLFGTGTSEIFRKVKQRHLIEKPSDSGFKVDELVRPFFYQKLDNKREIHFRVAKYYISLKNEDEDISEYLRAYYHYFRAEHYEDALAFTVEIGDFLLRQGKPDQLFGMIKNLKPVIQVLPTHLKILEAKVLELWGEWDESTKILMPLLNETREDMESFLNAINIILRIYDQKGDYERGLIFYSSQEEFIDSEFITPELSHLYLRIGRFHHELNNFDELMKYYNKSLIVSESIQDIENIIRTNRLIATAHWFYGKYDEALSILKTILPQCRDKFIRELSDTLKHIGIVYTKMGKFEEAIPFFNESIAHNRKIGHKHGLAWASMNFADSLIPLNKLEEAEKNLKDAMELFQLLGEKNGIMHTTLRLGILRFANDQNDAAVEIMKESLNLSQNLKSKTTEGLILENLSKVYDKMQDKENSFAVLLKAKDIYEEIGSNRIAEIKEILKIHDYTN